MNHKTFGPVLFLALVSVWLFFGVAPAQAAVGQSSSLAVGKSADIASGLIGTYLNFSISLTNLGIVGATNVVVQDLLPAGLAVVSASPGTGTYSIVSNSWTVPLLLSHVGADLMLTAKIISAGRMTNQVSIYSALPSNTNFAGNSASVVVTGMPVTGLAVQANQCDAQGRVITPLPGASVAVDGPVLGLTDAQGQWSSTNIPAGTHSVIISKSGFYPATRTVIIAPLQMPLETVVLAPNTGPGKPLVYDFNMPRGKYYVPAMPGTVTFTAMVAWNGTAGTVSFNINGAATPATLTDQGNGTALATVTVPAPASIPTASELIVTAVNGESLTRAFNAGAFFEPLPGMVSSWYTWLGNTISWANAAAAYAPKISYKYETNYTVFSYKTPNEDLKLKCTLGMNFGLGFTPADGKFDGSLGGNAAANLTVAIPGASGVEVFVEGSLGLGGTLKGAFAGLNPATFTPGWEVTASIKDGLKAPAVSFIPAVLPAAAPAVSFLQNTWGVKSLVNSLKLGATITEGGSLTGVYENLTTGSCFLYTTRINSSLTAGLELEASLKLGPAKAKVYGGGKGTLDISLCPQLGFNSLTLEAYVGVSASALFFSYKKEVSAQLVFNGSGPGNSLVMLPAARLDTYGEAVDLWQPIGATLAPWGEPNQLVLQLPSPSVTGSSSFESPVVSNVLDDAGPSVYADRGQKVVLFTLLDTNKPWYAATAIGELRQTNGGPWTLTKVTDDVVANCNPKVAAVNSNTLLAAWERVVGDSSQATNPVQVAANLEIVAVWFDPYTGTWTTPVQLTTNPVVDRDPLPVVFGSTQGILWIENAAGDLYGDAINGDRLLFSQWTGTGWTAPQTLWTAGTNGISSFSFVADGTSQGRVVFAVDQNGQWNSTTNRQLYMAATTGGVWQPAIQRTADALGNDMPVLVAPNGNPVCVWNRGGTLAYTPLSAWVPKAVYGQNTSANDAPSLEGVTMPGGAAIAYAIHTPDGVDLYASFYNAAADAWTLPRQFTSDPDEESSVALAYDGTNVVAAYDKTQLLFTNVSVVVNNQTVIVSNAPAPGRTDLYVLTHLPGADAGVVAGSLSLNPTNPPPGTNATISAVIENFGDLPLSGIPVAFYDGNPQAGGVMIGGLQFVSSLGGGATQEVSAIWYVPAGNVSHQIYVVVDPNNTLPDRDLSNNAGYVLTVLPDLVVDSTANTQEGATNVALHAQIVNQGVIPSGPFKVAWLLGSTNGPQIASCTVGSLAPGQSVPATATWNTGGQGFTGPYVPVYSVADSTNAVVEIDKSNNSYLQMVSVVANWVPQIAGITVTNGTTVKIIFSAANSEPSNFTVQGNGSLAQPASWQNEAGAIITTLSPGVFQATVPESGNTRFYRVLTSP